MKKIVIMAAVVLIIGLAGCSTGADNDTKTDAATTVATETSTAEETTKAEKQGNISVGEKNALGKAESYLDVLAYSHKGLVKQLKFDGFSQKEAVYGADNCGANWNEQAAKKAESYMDVMSYSRTGLIDQLKFDGFTSKQAAYGAKAVGY